ncbi:MAG: EamA family transporter [Puniceicoccales bacterium]|jgi:drug/metabolite transporter (DMT)-like permease|nr:EamA family transporter [Puniceicoccales bacterium]
MIWLIIVSLLWAFSFGLIKTHLTTLDSTAVAAVRFAFALVIFIPLLRPKLISWRNGALLVLIGAVQFGIMYAFYMASFAYLQSHEVALFTIFTPIYLTLINGVLGKRFQLTWFIAAIISVVGAGVILWSKTDTTNIWVGFGLVQLSNFCFALGQIAYKRLRPRLGEIRDDQLFGWLLLGGFISTGAYSLYATDWAHFHPSLPQWGVIAYLGAIASGLGFFMWNRGVAQTNAGTLAVFNNMKIPLAVICSLLFFHSEANIPRLIVSFGLLAFAVWLAEKKHSSTEK